jgi:D-alanyl-D-alanine carboxypeptidase
MWSRLLTCALLLLPAPALAGAKEKVAALAPSGLVLVMDAEGNELMAQNADKPFVPASVTKIVTAWLAMEVLGGDYRFETRFYLDKDRVLYVRGGGDPFLISEELAPLGRLRRHFNARSRALRDLAQEQWPIAFRAAPRHREWALTETRLPRRCPLWVISRH